MESVKVLIRVDDGSVTVMQFLTEGRGNVLPVGARWGNEAAGIWLRDATPENVGPEVMRTFVGGPQPLSYRIMAANEVLPDRYFRDAWADDGTMLGVDMARARVLHLARLRARRDEELVRLDRDWMRAQGQGRPPEAAAIEAQRQALRDLPTRVAPLIAAAATPAELKLVE